MRYLFVLLLLLSSSEVAVAATQQGPDPARVEAARRYAAVADLHKTVADTVEAMSAQLPEASRASFRKLMLEHVRIDVMNEAMVMVMVRLFTTEELNALADFYGSSAGKSVMSKFGVYMGQITPLIQAEMQRAIAEASAEEQRNSRVNGS